MSEYLVNRKTILWPKSSGIYIETVVIILLAIVSMSLEYGRLDSTVLLSPQLGVRVVGSLCIWFANKFILDYILQSRIDSNKVSQFLPFEMTIASVAVTSIIYLVFYPILLHLNDLSFLWPKFLYGLFVTSGLSLLIVIFYAGMHIWRSWWRDGEFLFSMKKNAQAENEWKDFITIKNSKETVNVDLTKVLYFKSEYKIVFLIDTSEKKWITQYNLSQLEKSLDDRFFRLNRRILVSRQVISQIKKLSNHRLLVTLGQANEDHKETVSRYRSTRFKKWFYNSQ
jgi:hypothetical protein